ncbi:MAG: oligosaccharide flippase family protein [Faecousia sp.]
MRKLTNAINPTALNILTNLTSFILTFGISFYVTPYVTKNVGMEAYGLIGLANNFTSYISIATAALNSMASRFIILQFHKNNEYEAKCYFNSALFANIIFAVLSLIGCALFIPVIDKVLNISPELVADAKVTFSLVFLSFAISLSLSVFSVGYYATNKLYVGAWRTIQSDMIRVVLLVLVFNYIGVKIQYTVAATLIASLIASIYAICFTKRNMNGLAISVHFFKLKHILEMVKGGIWNSISKLSQVLLNGLDLIITNLYIGGSILGNVSVAKTFSSIIISVIASVSDVFLPKFLKAYSKTKEALCEEFFKSTKILSFFSCIIISLFVVYSADFYKIWLPGEDWALLRNLSCISLISIAISGPIYSMFSIYTVVNKVKPQAVSTLIMSILSTGTVFVLLKTTNLGVYAIVCTSAVYGAIKNLTYNMYCLRKYIDLDTKKCYFIVARNVFTMILIILASFLFKRIIAINSFTTLIFNGLFGACIACVIYFICGTGFEDKKRLLNYILHLQKG